MALTNGERQRRWREKRNDLAQAMTGKPKDIAEAILVELGTERAKKVLRALKTRLDAIKPDCKYCGGTGYRTAEMFLACRTPILDPDGSVHRVRLPCDCRGFIKPVGSKMQVT